MAAEVSVWKARRLGSSPLVHVVEHRRDPVPGAMALDDFVVIHHCPTTRDSIQRNEATFSDTDIRNDELTCFFCIAAWVPGGEGESRSCHYIE